MLYKFKSKVTGDLIMLEPNGRRVLQIIGKDLNGADASKGIVLPEQMSAAVAALQAAVAKEEAERQAASARALAEGKEAPKYEAPGLRQRTLPFIDMLRRCEPAGEPVTWGV
ncbi:DUF1840 domain-containing protein [Rhodoferax sp.]|uniref:DUF1840 domain-containing protein n=1 Tax=Rhodoferax sp. TaxID=50421 RepID=UPI00274B04FF|nr:DUF1840 domain-containing protein [Rhodoferax sp.]